MQNINVNIVPDSYPQTIRYSQGDVGREFKINVVGFTIPTGATVKIQATKPSGFGFSVAGTVAGNAVSFTTTAIMTDEAGRFPAELEITKDSVVIGTANFIMWGEANPHPEGTTDGQQGTIIPELTLLVERVEAAASSVLDMQVVAETLAAGSQASYSYDEDTNTATFGIPQGEAGAGAAGVVASAYSSSKTYKVGDYVLHNSNLYRCTTAITTAEAFTAAHWTQIVLADDVSDLKSDLDNTKDALANPFDLVLGSTNLFDNNFDSSGYINVSTGADASSASYKRTSRFYEIFDTSATQITIRLSSTISTFNVVFYATDKTTCLGYGGASNTTFKQRDIPSGSKYFRVYTDATYNLSAYIGTVNVDTIIPYREKYVFKDNSINSQYLADTLKNRTNLVDVVNDNKYLNYANGNISNNVDDYRVTDLITIDASTEYICGLFNASNAPNSEIKAISVAFYDSSGAFISGVYSSGNTHTNCSWDNGLLLFTSPNNATFARMGANDSAKPYRWLFAKSIDSRLYTASNSIKVNNNNLNIDLQGKVVACFGDSIIGNTRDDTSTPFYISEACGAMVHNFGFGGCRMSVHSGDWDKCSMYRLADDIFNNDFSALVTAINTGWSGMPGYFENTVAWLAMCDFSTVDAIIISYGTNDYRDSQGSLDNPLNKFDTSTVCGALRYSIKQIQRAYPSIQILVTPPIYRAFLNESNEITEDSDTKDWGTGTLIEYAEAFKSACEDMKVPFLDLYHNSGINLYTEPHFFPVDDGTHPNAYGRERLGTLIGNKLKELL